MSQGPVLLNSEQYQVKTCKKGFNSNSKGLVIIDPHKTMMFGSPFYSGDPIVEEDLLGTQFTQISNEEEPHITIKTCSSLRPKLINYTSENH